MLQLTIEHDPHGHQYPLQKSARHSTSLCAEPSAYFGAPPSSPIVDSHLEQDATVLSTSAQGLTAATGSQSPGSDADRAFRRKDDTNYVSGTKTRQLRKTKNLNLNCAVNTNSLKEKERCSSMSKLLDENHPPHPELYDLSRTKSFRLEPKPQRIFRANDLVQGELLGKGFFGQVFKVISDGQVYSK